jgi:protein-S-isoprenylcysteine O-methyltransferase Ste14
MTRRRSQRRRGGSSAGVRNAVGGVLLVVVLLLLGQGACNLAREGSWLGVAEVAGTAVLLLLIVLASLRWGHIRFGASSTNARSRRKSR